MPGFPDVWRAGARVEEGSPDDERLVLERVSPDEVRLSDALGVLAELAAEVGERAARRKGLAVLAYVQFGRGLSTRSVPATTEKLHASFSELDADGAGAALGAVAEMAERVFGGRGGAEEAVGSPANAWRPGGRPRGTWPRASDTGWWSLGCQFKGPEEEQGRTHSIHREREGDDLGGALDALVEAGEEAVGVRWREYYDPFEVQGNLRWYPPNPSGSGHVRFAPRDRLLAIFRQVTNVHSALVALEAVGDAAERVYSDGA